jgi:hypothetical protein
MPSVELKDHEWQQVITALAMQNPLVGKIAQQLQGQQSAGAPRQQTVEETRAGIRLDGQGDRP